MKASKSTEKEITGFHFEEMPLSEALPLVQAGEGNYAELKAEVLLRIPRIEAQNAANGTEPKSLNFSLPGKDEAPEDQRRTICQVLNMTLTKAGIWWKVTYSSRDRLFLVVPKQGKMKPSYPPSSSFSSSNHQSTHKDSLLMSSEGRKILDLIAAGLSPRAVAEKMGIPAKRVYYVTHCAKIQRPPSPDVDQTMKEVEQVACHVFRTTPEIIRGPSHTGFKAAIMAAARQEYNFRFPQIATYFGHHPTSAKQAVGRADPKLVKALVAALPKN